MSKVQTDNGVVGEAINDLAIWAKGQGEGDHFWFVRHIVDNEYIVPHVHGEIAGWLSSPERLRLRKFNGIDIKAKLCLIMIPRDSLKTTFVSSGYPLWRLIRNPDIRVLLDSESRDLSKSILKNIKDIIDNCDTLRSLWGNLNGSEKGNSWNLEAIRVVTREDYKAKEDTIETSGVDVAVTGRHYNIIIMDDLHSERNSKSKEQIEKVVDHIQLMMPLLESDGELIVIGTRWADDDAYGYLLELKDDAGEPLFDTFIHSAYNDDGTAYYPERNDLSTLALKKAVMRDSLFSCQYLLDPIPEAIAPLKKSHLQFLDIDKIPLNLNRFMMCDTIGDKKILKGDYFAVTTWGIDQRLNELGLCNLYLLDGFCGWFDTEQQIQSISNLYMKTRPLEFGIEKSGMNTLSLHLQNNLSSKGLHLLTTELKPMGREKGQRILQFTPYAQNGMIYINKACNQEFLDEFLYEWSRFPKGKRDDCLDASAYVFDFLAKYPIALYGFKRNVRPLRAVTNWKVA